MKRFFFFLVPFLMGVAPQVEEGGTGPIRVGGPFNVVISKITDYTLFKEIRQKLRQSDTNVKLIPVTEAPGFVEYRVESTGTAAALTDFMKSNAGDKVTVELKTLPSGAIEVDISPK